MVSEPNDDDDRDRFSRTTHLPPSPYPPDSRAYARTCATSSDLIPIPAEDVMTDDNSTRFSRRRDEMDDED
jgi:hypothetical protein